MKTIAIGLIAAAAVLAACTASSPEQATAPAAGQPLTYPAHNMSEFESAQAQAEDYCYKKNDLQHAVYASRTYETASFECAAK